MKPIDRIDDLRFQIEDVLLGSLRLKWTARAISRV
jgi:hypothetical protein